MSEKLVTVCDSCLCASCWQYEFLCENYKEAGTRQMTIPQLRELNREHPCYWKADHEIANDVPA